MSSAVKPVLSVVVAIVSDTTKQRADASHLAGCLEALSCQSDPPSMEVIVPCSPDVDGIDALRARFPDVVFLPVADVHTAPEGGSREHHDVLRARGMAAASGDVIALLEDHARPDPRWAAAIVAAHHAGYAAIGGAIENGIDRALNWAVYYCDFGRYQNPVPSGESLYASDANVSYKRAALEELRPLWQQTFREVVVNGQLISSGRKVALRPDIVVYQHRSDLRLADALRERYIWGRSYAMTRSELLTNARRLTYAALSPVLPGVMLYRLAVIAWSRRRHFRKFLSAAPAIAILLASWSLGEGVGYLSRSAAQHSTLRIPS
jgi:hypothetical protein